MSTTVYGTLNRQLFPRSGLSGNSARPSVVKELIRYVLVNARNGYELSINIDLPRVETTSSRGPRASKMPRAPKLNTTQRLLIVPGVVSAYS